LKKDLVESNILCRLHHHSKLKQNKMKASELKIGDTFRKQGILHKVIKITNEQYKNGKQSLMVECLSSMNGKNIGESVFHFQLETKIK